MSEWKKIKLSECCSSIADGDHQPPPKAEAGIPFVTISNMTSTNQFDFSDTSFVPQDYYDKLDLPDEPEWEEMSPTKRRIVKVLSVVGFMVIVYLCMAVVDIIAALVSSR